MKNIDSIFELTSVSFRLAPRGLLVIVISVAIVVGVVFVSMLVSTLSSLVIAATRLKREADHQVGLGETRAA